MSATSPLTTAELLTRLDDLVARLAADDSLPAQVERLAGEAGSAAGVDLAQIARTRIGDARLVVRRLRAEVETLIAKRDATRGEGK